MGNGKKILVLGGSFGGLTAALEIKRRLGERAEVTVISPDDHFVFLPSLPWLVTGHRTVKRLSLPLSRVLTPRRIEFIRDSVKGVEPAAQRVQTEQGAHGYDYLVIATGPRLACEEIRGLGPISGFTHCVFNLKHATQAKAAWEELLADPGPVVLGSTQFASCFGPYYELAFELDYELRRRKLRHKVPMVYLSSEPYPGHMGIDGLGRSRRFIEDEFAQRDIKAVVNQSVAGIEADAIHLTDGTSLPFKLAMLAPPFKGVTGVAELGNPRGFIPVDQHYRHPQHPNIYTVGVAAALAPREPTPVPTGIPKTGYMTIKMAQAAAAHLAAEIEHRPPPEGREIDELAVVCLLDMGNRAALMLADPILPPRQRAILHQGRWVRWAKMGLERYFLWKMRHGHSNLP